MKKPVVLRIYKGEQLLGVKQFLAPQIVIGQPGDVQVPLEGESVSLLHASIEEREPGKYFVSDLGSSTGTLLNGKPVLDQQVESGDTLGIGEYRVEFFIGPPKPKAVAALNDAETVTSFDLSAPLDNENKNEVREEKPAVDSEEVTQPGIRIDLVAESHVEDSLSAKLAEAFGEPKSPATNETLPPVVMPAARPPKEEVAPAPAPKPTEPSTEAAKQSADASIAAAAEAARIAAMNAIAAIAASSEKRAEAAPSEEITQVTTPITASVPKPDKTEKTEAVEAKPEAKPEAKLELKAEAKPAAAISPAPPPVPAPAPEATATSAFASAPISAPSAASSAAPSAAPSVAPSIVQPTTPQETAPKSADGAPAAPQEAAPKPAAPQPPEPTQASAPKPVPVASQPAPAQTPAASQPAVTAPKPITPQPTTPQAPTAPQKPTQPPAAVKPAGPTPSQPTAVSKPAAPPSGEVKKPTQVPPAKPTAQTASAGIAASTGGGFGLVGPRGSSRGPNAGGPKSSGEHKKHAKKKTFAPPSKYNDVQDYIKPSKGTVVEVLVAWRERVISTHHFVESKTITIGSHPANDIVVPLFANRVRKLPILKIDRQAVVIISPEMTGEVIKGQTSSTFAELMRTSRLGKAGGRSTLPLEQGEMVRIELSDQVSVLIRYTSDSPKPMVAPLFDLSASETTGIVLAFALVATLKLYMMFYQTPKVLPTEEDNQPNYQAKIVLTPPTPPPLPPPPPPQPTPVAVQPTPAPTPVPVKVKVAEKTQETQKKAEKPKAAPMPAKPNPGASAAVALTKNVKGPRERTSVQQGGSVKVAAKESSQMKSKPARDISKMGAFSAFANGGMQENLAQGTQGAGELAGMANAATGKTGSAANRAGKGLGSELKDTGVGGSGKSLEGIAGGVGTVGRGSGVSGVGEGNLGTRSGTKIVTGGSGEEISGTIDREAIRRVIRANLPAIKACYERELNRKPDLFGKLVISWDIGEQGRVTGARVKTNELGSDAVAKCIIDKLKTWKFPEPPANQVAEVAYPFLFSN